MLTVHCPLITRLVLRDCPWVDQSSLNYFSQHHSLRPGLQMEDVLLYMGRGLRTDLKARTKARYRGKDQLFDAMKKKRKSTKRFKNLLELDLNGCDLVTDDNIHALTGVFKYLEVLRIGSIPGISDYAMKSVAIDLKQLHTLDIRCIYIYAKLK